MRRWIWSLLRLFLFRLDAEWVHETALRRLKLLSRFGRRPLFLLSGLRPGEDEREDSAITVWGMKFLSPVGMAAGFDKNAIAVPAYYPLGFGFVEIGTVTPRAQPGNPQPRLFRVPGQQAIFNRMGFNNLGAEAVAKNLAEARSRLPEHFRVGVNLGKNKDTAPAMAKDDYRAAAASFRSLADYLVINVSSPNTPGLRELQTMKSLTPIIESVANELSHWEKRPPLLLKLAPELDVETLNNLIPESEKAGIDGWVLTNTLEGAWKDGIRGGWSGRLLGEPSLKQLLIVRSLTQRPIISVGGIMTEQDAVFRLQRAGANLIQLYSGWIYQGPDFPIRIRRQLLSS